MIPMTTSSGTSLPASMYSLAFLPISVPSFTAARKDVARGNLGNVILVDELFRLGPFPGPRSAQQDKIHMTLELSLLSCKLSS